MPEFIQAPSFRKKIFMVNTKQGLTAELITELQDEQTVFALAVLMMDLHVATLMKNKAGVANSFLKTGVLLRNNPGFSQRFRKTQAEIIKYVQGEQPPKSFGSNPPDDQL